MEHNVQQKHREPRFSDCVLLILVLEIHKQVSIVNDSLFNQANNVKHVHVLFKM